MHDMVWREEKYNKKVEMIETCSATSDWLKPPLLPQSPTTKKLRERSAFGSCSNCWSSAVERTEHKLRIAADNVRHKSTGLFQRAAMVLV
jgi:hypothetical protein